MSAVVMVFAACALACAAAHGAILHSVIRSRNAHPDAGVPRPKLLVEILWALLPALVLAFVLTATWERVREHATPTPDVMMKIAR